MNKYQEALNNLDNIICELSCELKQDYELYTRETGCEKYINILQELVDKDTPKKVSPKWRTGYDPKLYYPKSFYCPSCSRQLRSDQSYKCCPKCGQALDWSYE